MGESTKISWTDATFNPWVGCQKVAPGCQFCYAEADMDQRRHFALWGPGGTRVKTSEANWRKPLKWNRDAAAVNTRRRVFCSSLADVFEDWTGAVSNTAGDVWTKPYLDSESQVANWQTCDPETQRRDPQGWRLVTMNDLRAELFAVIDATPNLDWQLLTKRPENILKMWPVKHDRKPIFPGMPGPLGQPQPCIIERPCRQNVWLGTSISDQATADKAIPELVKCRDLAPVLFLSAEPLLGPIDLTPWLYDNCCGGTRDHLDMDGEYLGSDPCPCQGGPVPSPQIDWVIVGGESGPNARPCQEHWIRDLVQQCEAAGVPCFVKQLGSDPRFDYAIGGTDKLHYLHAKGGDPAEWPECLRVQQFPEGAHE